MNPSVIKKTLASPLQQASTTAACKGMRLLCGVYLDTLFHVMESEAKTSNLIFPHNVIQCWQGNMLVTENTLAQISQPYYPGCLHHMSAWWGCAQKVNWITSFQRLKTDTLTRT